MNEVKDVPVVLNNLDYEDDYEGDFSSRRAIIYTLQFTVKTYLYGPISESKTIKKAQVDYYTSTNTTSAPRQVRYAVTPQSTIDRDGVVVTTSSAAIGTTATSVTVADASTISQWDNIYIGSETMRVTKKVSNTLTVIRAHAGTAAGSHASGANVYKIDAADDALLEADDDFGFNELTSNYQDMKKYNPVSGSDENI